MVHTQAPHTLDEATLAALMQPEAGADPLAQAREAGASILNSGRNQPSSPTAEENEREAASHEALEACEMAEGAIRHSASHLAVAVTGIAGPGGTADKPGGRVHLAVANRDGVLEHRQMDYGDIGRTEVRLATVTTALEMMLTASKE